MSAMWYNFTKINATDTLEMVQSVDNLFFFHFLGLCLLITLFVIIYRGIIYYSDDVSIAYTYSFFFIAILSIIFKILSLVNDYVVFLCWGFLALSVAIKVLQG